MTLLAPDLSLFTFLALLLRALAAAWNQNAGLAVISPIAAKLEEVAQQWLLDILGLPSSSAVGFVTGATQASFTCLAAARHSLLAARGWNVEARGLLGAPPPYGRRKRGSACRRTEIPLVTRPRK